MIANIRVECETAGDLTTALYQAIKEIKKISKKNGGHGYDFPEEMEFEDDNCYGSYEMKIKPDPEVIPLPELPEEMVTPF